MKFINSNTLLYDTRKYEFIIQNDKLISTERIKVSILVLTLCKQINIRLKGILTYPARTFAENKLN